MGPFHPSELYRMVNYDGTRNVIKACLALSIRKVVMSSSPSTRFDGSDLDGLGEDDLPELPLKRYMQVYAETKALGELAIRAACDGASLLTVAVAPHQVYGPRDTLFLPNVLEAAGLGRLRVFGNGQNWVCFTYVDNNCHGMILAEQALYPGSPALGGFYIVTDGATHLYAEGYDYFWDVLDRAGVGMGFAPLHSRRHIPTCVLYLVAYACELFGWLSGVKLKLNPFAARAATMHRWFRISSAQRDLHYEPIVPYTEGWRRTLDWFREHWLSTFDPSGAGARLAVQTRGKIDAQLPRS
ncbi:hypothetical protein T492DRAFT_838361 [Pavlovales sp. CCMP2436]|nr:hypothetical protein T492DRAFT_838361 [Pavlovales sp. CCMP2436]